MDLYLFSPVLLVVFGIAPFFMSDFLFKKKKVQPKVIYYSIKKFFDNPFYGDETEISLFDAELGEINKYSFDADENKKNCKKICKYLEAMLKTHKNIVLVTCDQSDMHLDLVFKYALKEHMSFNYDDYLFMNLKTMYYYAYMDVDFVSFEDILPDFDDNVIPIINYAQLFKTLCNDMDYDPDNLEDMLALRETI